MKYLHWKPTQYNSWPFPYHQGTQSHLPSHQKSQKFGRKKNQRELTYVPTGHQSRENNTIKGKSHINQIYTFAKEDIKKRKYLQSSTIRNKERKKMFETYSIFFFLIVSHSLVETYSINHCRIFKYERIKPYLWDTIRRIKVREQELLSEVSHAVLLSARERCRESLDMSWDCFGILSFYCSLWLPNISWVGHYVIAKTTCYVFLIYIPPYFY